MRKWGWIVTALYGFIVIALLVPLVPFLLKVPHLHWRDLRDAYATWVTWSCAALIIFSQVLLLWLSVDTTRKKLKPRTPVVVTALTSGLLMMVLTFLIALCLILSVWGDSPPDRLIVPLFAVGSSWIVWGILFYRLWRESEDPVTRAVKWLFRGSVLELLIAVPTHVIVRRRGDCCAPAGSAFGIATGIAIMLISFGPSLLLLVKRRTERYAAKEVVSS
jgi:hypothetical protein